ncbi:MAG: Thiamine pyrophosphate-requiring enzymes [uncultured Sphingomonas sp.]|uniref:Thiamine pyrophosphate-requiring enzymes n=1 Tax=uncultured Sphingomonas sp. TaxID=158754 RepID=A0A6J4SK15_9SPHN|nr:thiamine pyrophosphate-binding protein [uncultured Sphingomonas sp.]CAA9500579.1 MAG: Thiamine pyrophosphate-requiring enzymes [uncultured Sphingomonas sp.]
MPDSPPLRTGGRILVDQLRIQGCDRIFTVPGESFLAVLDALHDTPEIDRVVCRQEGGVSYMAEADGKLTGRPGVAFVTRGPGATNATPGVHVAFQDSTPMILFVGDLDRRDKDREGFQEIDFPVFFGPIAKWAARIDDAARIPEYVARAWRVATAGRPGPVVLALPEDMLRDEVAVPDRPPVPPVAESPDPSAVAALIELMKDAAAPVAIVGGADWGPAAAHHFANFAARNGIPVAAAFRRQDAVPNSCRVYAGNTGYGPNPKLTARIKAADLLLVVGARLGESTTDGYTLVTPDHPGQTLVHVHPDPNELGRVYHADLPICADMGEFAQMLDTWMDPDLVRFGAGEEAHAEWLEWSEPQAREGVAMDLGVAMRALREQLPADTIVCNGAGNFSGWVHRYWRYAGCPSQLAPTSGSMGYGLPAAVAAALRFRDRQVLCVAGDGDFLMNGQELATAAQYGADLLVIVVDNGSYGTIRMHQERDYPERLSATDLTNPDFAALGRAYGAWAETVERTEAFAPAFTRAQERRGIRLLHVKTDVEVISNQTTISALRAKARG